MGNPKGLEDVNSVVENAHFQVLQGERPREGSTRRPGGLAIQVPKRAMVHTLTFESALVHTLTSRSAFLLKRERFTL